MIVTVNNMQIVGYFICFKGNDLSTVSELW